MTSQDKLDCSDENSLKVSDKHEAIYRMMKMNAINMLCRCAPTILIRINMCSSS